MTSNKLIGSIASRLREGSMVVWCGAGISVPSGLPRVNELVKALLAGTRLTPKERAQVASIVPNRLPFERLMEVVLDAMDETAQRSLLKLFTLGQPNANHMFLARLRQARSGKDVLYNELRYSHRDCIG